jgi:DNA repair protein RecO (recombination protein O)
VLYRAYGDALRALAAGEGQEVVLRRFELALLQELGYGLQLDSDADGAPVRPEPLRLYNRARRGALDEYGIDDPSVVAGRVLSTWPAAISASPKPWPAPRR